MLAALLLLMQASAPPPAAARPETWEPWIRWGCVMRQDKAAPYVLNGFVARRNDPDHPVEFKRHERALRIIRDDSGALANRQARSPLFVVRPDEFWATFFDTVPGAASKQRMLILKIGHAGGPGTAQLFAGGGSSKPYAKGQCLGKVVDEKAKS